MSHSKQFQVMASGCVLRGFSIAQVKNVFASRFNVTEDIAQRCLNKKPTVMKKALTKAAALQYRDVLISVGMDAAIEPMAGPFTVADGSFTKSKSELKKPVPQDNDVEQEKKAASYPLVNLPLGPISVTIIRNTRKGKPKPLNWQHVHSVFFCTVLACSVVGVFKRIFDLLSTAS